MGARSGRARSAHPSAPRRGRFTSRPSSPRAWRTRPSVRRAARSRGPRPGSRASASVLSSAVASLRICSAPDSESRPQHRARAWASGTRRARRARPRTSPATSRVRAPADRAAAMPASVLLGEEAQREAVVVALSPTRRCCPRESRSESLARSGDGLRFGRREHGENTAWSRSQSSEGSTGISGAGDGACRAPSARRAPAHGGAGAGQAVHARHGAERRHERDVHGADGFLALPPSGPATPVMPTPTSTFARSRRPPSASAGSRR